MKHFKAKKYYLLASFLVILVTFVIYRGLDTLFFTTEELEPMNEVYLVPVQKIPVLKEKLGLDVPSDLNGAGLVATNSATNYVSYQDFANSITAKSAYVEDIDTGTVLFERNSERILLPASTTKLMTALVALDEFQLDQVIVVPELPRIEGFNYEFAVGEQMYVKDLLKATLIQSNNDAAYILALSSSAGIESFVQKMNTKAQALQLQSTQYKNPAGFDEDAQRSSAHDLVILSKEFMKNEFLASVVATKTAEITDLSGKYTHAFESTHKLLGVDPTVVGIKTGTTEGAAQVLITQFKRENHNIIVVVMGSDDRYLETTKLVDWVFNSYVWISPEEVSRSARATSQVEK